MTEMFVHSQFVPCETASNSQKDHIRMTNMTKEFRYLYEPVVIPWHLSWHCTPGMSEGDSQPKCDSALDSETSVGASTHKHT